MEVTHCGLCQTAQQPEAGKLAYRHLCQADASAAQQHDQRSPRALSCGASLALMRCRHAQSASAANCADCNNQAAHLAPHIVHAQAQSASLFKAKHLQAASGAKQEEQSR